MGNEPRIEAVVIDSVVGPLTLYADATHILALHFGASREFAEQGDGQPSSAVLEEGARQLDEYFGGTRKRFDLPFLLQGTSFQKQVWRAIAAIDFGEVATYKEVAVQLGNTHLARAVGQAANRNPVPIVIPCHRLVGSGGWLGGFAPGVGVKERLLAHEKYAGSLDLLKRP